jgi:Ca2+-transporting ATPase
MPNKKKEKQVYNLSPEEVVRKFSTSRNGLQGEEILKRQNEFGPNKIERKESWKWLRLIFGQFNDALVWILLVAAGLAFVFGEYRDVTIILIIVFVNASIGFFQEFRAEKTLESLKNLTSEKALVIRGGEKKEIDSKEVVPGDVIFLGSGGNVPADGYLLESYNLKINSVIFTGESKPQNKRGGIIQEENLPLAEIENMVFMGESVVDGEGTFVVTGTGMNTELGKIAHLVSEVSENPTPLQKSIRELGRNVTILSIFIGIVVMIAGQYFKLSLYQNFLFALALSVSVVPEGLPAAISVALSLGMKKLLKNNVLAKKLNAVETLGSVSMICTDKTGTITRNELTVTRVILGERIIEISGVGYEPKGDFYLENQKIDPENIPGLENLFRIGSLCNDASLVEDNGRYKIIGDPTEGAIIVAGKKFNNSEKFYEIGEKKITENPFSSDRMMMSVAYQNSKTISYVKGSPDVLLEK